MQLPAGPAEVKAVGAATLVVGAASLTTSAFAVVSSGPNILPGPSFVTTTVQVIVPPALMFVDDAVLLTRKL